MTQEWLKKTLVSLGLSQIDAEVYVFLSTRGFHNIKSIAEALHMRKQQLYQILKNLQSRGIVNVSHELPEYFSAVRIEEIIDNIINAKKEQAITLQQNKEELLLCWRALTNKNNSCG